ncbi:MAG: GAF domain-containing protein [Chloroflexi bacterium]|nr:GAF domain-containing protein [Chloroflexota bacterium]
MSEDIQTQRQTQQEMMRLRAENASLRKYVERLQQTIRGLNDLHRSLDSITPDVDVYNLIHELLNHAIAAVGSENGSLLLLDDDSGELVFVDVIGASRGKLMNYRLPKGIGVAGDVAEKRQPSLVSDVTMEPTFSPMVDKHTGLQTKSLLCVPLWDGKRTIGVIEAVNMSTERSFDTDDQEVLMLAARLVSLAIVKAERVQSQ